MLDVTKLGLDNTSYIIDPESGENLNERFNQNLASVCCHRIPELAILDQKKKILDLNVVKMHFFNQGRLTDLQINKILNDSSDILRKETNLLNINTSCYILGDIHGQFYDLIAVLDQFDFSKDCLVFLGDYVDRGSFSVEVYLYLMLLKTHYPNSIYVLRGNHESKKMTTFFTFKSECLHKYNLEVYLKFIESFKTLPIAAIIQKSAFCCHGGISPLLKNVYDLNNLNRFCEIEYNGLFCDIFWSDPHPEYDYRSEDNWVYNPTRKCSVYFSYKNVVNFLQKNNLHLIIRGHEVQEDGYKLFKEYKGMPSLITLFSAPKYCDVYKNKGAIIEFDQKIVSIKQFEAVPHPYVLNGFLDGINWSLPFISEKILDFSMALFDELYKIEIVEEPDILLTKLAIMRAERENIDEFEDSDSQCDSIVLNTVEPETMKFEDAKEADQDNEEMKEKFSPNNISLELSPSMKGEVITNISQLNINKAIEDKNITVEISDDNLIETINIEAEPEKKTKERI